jgi:hypothetical protein
MRSLLKVLFIGLLAFIFAAFVTHAATAQTVKLGKVTYGFQIDTTTATGNTYTFTDMGKEYSYTIYESSNGSPYIISIGRKGKYPVWIGKEHPTLLVPAGTTLPEGTPLRLSSSGKAVMPYIKPNGHPHVRYVPFEVNTGS